MIDRKGSIREQIDHRRFRRPMKQALRRVLCGESYRGAAAAEGVDPSYLWRATGSIGGMREAHLRAWQESWGDRFPQVWEQHLEKLGLIAPGQVH